MGDIAEKFSKFWLLMWKNWKLQLRHPIQTLFEILVPVFFCAILVLVRSLVDSEEIKEIHYSEFSPSENNTLRRYTIAFSPNTSNGVNNLMQDVNELITNCRPNCENVTNSMLGFATHSQLENYLIASGDKRKVGVVFSDTFANTVKLPSKIDFTLRFPSELLTSFSPVTVLTWRTNLLYPIIQEAGPRERWANTTATPYYFAENFLALQSYVSQAFIEAKTGSLATSQPEIAMRRFPYPAFINDLLMLVMRDMIGLIIVLAFEYTAISIIKVITTEKEKQLKESMKIMGLPGWLHWTAWFVKSLLFMLISIIIMVSLFKISAWYDEGIPPVLPKCDIALLMIFLVLFAIATITLCFAISVFFTKANMAAGIGGVLFFLFLVPHTVLRKNYQELTLNTKLSASLMSNTAMAYGFQIICMFESTGEGLQWSNLFRPVTPDDNLTMAHILMMLVIDSVIYMLIALYVEAIFPGRYGVAKKWTFIFSWFLRKNGKIQNQHPSDINNDPTRYEEEPKNLKPGIDIRGLTKIYGKDKRAVNNIFLRMYEGQITVLLGHNGAGKTTTMSMLTGMENPTHGTAIVNGFDLRTQINKVRHSLGLCPQHNILFDELTVSEHIYFYSRLKGMPSAEIDNEITHYLKLLQLEDKRHKRSATLSGGMKRKLSVAVAFCGGSKVVMLDEPTAGMDPAARRALWQLVESQKTGRTVMLTTHFMDEADLLGDRIAIMAGGILQCCGSSFFLKKRYGAGYHLVIEKLPNCDVAKITATVRQHIAHAGVESNIGSELTYLLNEEDAHRFQPMLSNIEDNLEELGIGSYGISLTTLEEVFMKVGADSTSLSAEKERVRNGIGDAKVEINGTNGIPRNPSETRRIPIESRNPSQTINVDVGGHKKLTGASLRLNHIRAMFMKRALTTIRSWQLFVVQILIPIILLIFAIQSGKKSAIKELPSLPIRLQAYHDSVTLVQRDGEAETYKAATTWLKTNNLASKPVVNITKYLLKLTSEEPGTVRMSYIIAGEFGKNKIVGWFNNDPYHTPPLVLNLVYNSILKSIDPEYEISVNNYPLPLSVNSTFRLLQQGNNMGFQLAVNVGYCMTFISAFYILYYIRERVCKVKHLQFVSGVNILIFWSVSYLWDWFTYLLTILALLVTLICFQEDGYRTFQDIGNLTVVLLYFAFGMFPIIYLLSFWYTVPSTGFTRVILYTTIFGTFAFMVVEILNFEALELQNIARILDWIFMFIPHYALTSGIRNTNLEYLRYTTCKKAVEICVKAGFDEDFCWSFISKQQHQCADRTEHYFTWTKPGILRNIIITMLVGAVCLIILILIEFKMFDKLIYSMQGKKQYDPIEVGEDDDVVAERQRIQALSPVEIANYNLVVRDMTKYYKKFLAVKGLCLGVNRYECFGLLGVNGAGKTSSFRMITGDTDISSGDVFVKGLNLKYNIKEVYKQIGYCPQFDALFDDLTGRETITVFSLLRGFERSECDFIAETLAKELDFYQHLDKKVRQMSGGNKRKLSTAVALIGDPPIIYLDEPTTGMDPATKRHLWNVLCKIRDEGKCLILTTHSMEECEALCTRLAIMVNGQFKCIGSTQHLKSKFSRGFTLILKIRKQAFVGEASVARIAAFVQEHFPTAELREQHQEMITYYIPEAGMPWSMMFGIMENSKASLEIEDYSIGQTSLEQVFLKFTQQQT